MNKSCLRIAQYGPGGSLAALLSLVVVIPVNTTAQEAVIEEIIVTAQKRDQNMQIVPIAVTALTSEDLGHLDVTNMLDLNTALPSVSFTPAQSKMTNTKLRIRGVSQVGNNPAFEGSVGVYVDDVYRSRSGMVLMNLNDINAMEILRGPQGTLFGKNTSGGAVTLRSNEPTSTFTSAAELRMGEFNRRQFSAYISGPVSESLSYRFSVLDNVQDGFITSSDTGTDYGDNDSSSYKVQALYNPSEDFRLRVIADYSESEEQCCYGNTVRITDDSLDSLLYQPLANSVGYSIVSPADPFEYHNTVNRLGEDRVKDRGVSIDALWDLNRSSFRSITSFRKWDYDQPGGDADFGPVDLLELSEGFEIDTISQEFNFSGNFLNIGPLQTLDFVTGLYFSREEIDHDRSLQEGIHAEANWVTLYDTILGVMNFTNPAAPGYLPSSLLATPGVDVYRGNLNHVDRISALYGHVIFEFNDTWSLVSGLRYSNEKKSATHRTISRSDLATQSLGAYLLGASIGGRDFRESKTFEELTGNIAVQYFTESDNMFYLSYARGHKAGGISLNIDAGGEVPAALSPTGFTPITDPFYNPEFVDAYEFGYKSQQYGGLSRTNISIFYQDYENIQFEEFTGTEFIVYNASDAVSQGIELENSLQLGDFFQSSVSIIWLDAQYGSGPGAPTQYIGEDLDFAPSLASNVGLYYDRPINAATSVFANFNWSYYGEHGTGLEAKQDSYDVVNLTFGLKALDSGWSLALWCKNCADEGYTLGSFEQPFYFGGAQAAFLGAPRMVGASLGFSF